MVTWTRNSDDISSLEDSHNYIPSQMVVPNGRVYTAGDYSNILTVSGRLPGVYGVSVTNDRTATPVIPARNIVIIGDLVKWGNAEVYAVTINEYFNAHLQILLIQIFL